jgi:hypothetical protein
MLSKRLLIFPVISIIILSIIPFPAPAQDSTQKENEITPPIPHKKIIEEIDVTHVEVPVRVFSGGKPVPGLKKSDFQLLVNGKETEIRGFYQSRKKIDPAAAAEPRLFVLMFNICDYQLEIAGVLDRFFHLVLRPHDRLILVTNHFFIDDTIILNPEEEKQKLEKILQLEKGRTELELKKLELELKSMVRTYKYRGNRHPQFKEVDTQDFINSYMHLVRQFKGLYLDLSTEKYIRLARYLNAQTVERWVLTFYQIGWFYKPKFGSGLFKSILGVEENSPDLFNSLESLRTYDRIQEVFEAGDSLPQDDLFKLFAGTGAAFHTLPLEHVGNMSNEFAQDLNYVPVVSDTYTLLKNLSLKTGGRVSPPNEIDSFYQRLLSSEDLHYVLTYVPKRKEDSSRKKEKQQRIKVIVKNRDCQVYYDNQKRGGYYRRIMEKIRITIPQIKINQVTYENQVLSFIVSNFKISTPSSDDTRAASDIIKLPVRIQVFDQNSQSLFDGVQMFELTGADLQGKEAKVRLKVDFPRLPPGDYNVFIWVGDLLTGKRDLAIKSITIPQLPPASPSSA